MINKVNLLSAIILICTSLNVLADNFYKPDGYHIETIDLPNDKVFHITGLDICSNNRVFAATRLGEVWALENNRWSMFADGLHEPTGLLCDENSVIVAHKPEMTRIQDTNKDGLADKYTTITNNWEFHDNYHEFTFGPVKDKLGNYYGTLNLSHGDPNALSLGAMGSSGGYRGFAFKVNTKGEFIPYAWGLRSPAGIGISPNDEIFFTDNQGDWVPTSTFNLLKPGKFYGHPVSLIDLPKFNKEKVKSMTVDDFDAMRQPPTLWIPHVEVANSPGNPEWDITQGKFGPFSGQIFVGDQTQSNIFRVLLDKVNGEYQGAVINFMNGFQSGNIRLSFDQQGQLWVGQTARGWGAKGGKPFGLQKVVWDGTTPFELDKIKLTKKGFILSFTDEIKSESINKNSFTAQQWHYRYSGDYGSPKVDLTSIEIKTIKQIDEKTIEVVLPLVKGNVVQLNFKGLQDISGRYTSSQDVYYTINELRD